MADIQVASPTDTSSQPLAQQPAEKVGRRDPWLTLVPLVLLGIISALAYFLGFTQPFLLGNYYQEPLLDVGKITGRAAHAANWWAISWTVLFASYYLAFRICPPAIRVSDTFRRTVLLIICLAAAAFSVYLIFIYPITAADLYDQIFRGRITTHYGRNTFLTSPSTFAGDPFLPFVAWNGEGSPYGPVWEMLAAIPSWLARDSMWNNLVFFKVLVVLAYGVSTILTYRILRALKPEWALRGTLFFAWNPLVVFEVAGNGHNDSIVVMWLLLAIYLFVRGYRTVVLSALMAGVLTKFVPVLLVPIAAAALWRDRARLDGAGFRDRLMGQFKRSSTPAASPEGDGHVADGGIGTQRPPLSNVEAFATLAIGGLLALGLAVILYAPFWQGTQTVGALGRQGLFTASIPTVLVGLFETRLGMDTGQAQGLARNLSLALTALTAIGLTLFVFFKGYARMRPDRRALVFRTLGALYEMIFIYLAFANLWFQPWYLIWLVALTAPVALYTNANRTILFCIGGILNYFVWDFLWLWNGSSGLDNNVTAILVVYFLPLFYTLYSTVKPIYDRAVSREVSNTRERQESGGVSLQAGP